MTYPTDDLTPLLAHEPAGRVKYGQGILREWDPDTFQNVVEWRGTLLRNLPVKSAANTIGFTSGITVSLMGVAPPDGGAESWWIEGQIVKPGTGVAEQAIAFMRTTLAAQVARGVIGEAIHFDGIDTIETLTSETNFTDLDTVGPRVSDIEVSDVGRAVVEFGCTMSSDTALDNIAVSFEVRDADNNVVLAPHGARAIQLTFVDPVLATLTRTVLAELPGAGRYTFTMKYSHSFSTATAQFGHRHMIVTPY